MSDEDRPAGRKDEGTSDPEIEVGAWPEEDEQAGTDEPDTSAAHPPAAEPVSTPSGKKSKKKAGKKKAKKDRRADASAQEEGRSSSERGERRTKSARENATKRGTRRAEHEPELDAAREPDALGVAFWPLLVVLVLAIAAAVYVIGYY